MYYLIIPIILCFRSAGRPRCRDRESAGEKQSKLEGARHESLVTLHDNGRQAVERASIASAPCHQKPADFPSGRPGCLCRPLDGFASNYTAGAVLGEFVCCQ
jgi:hypothetical protein